MTHYTAEKLYQLLPAIYRIRDAEQGGVLKALLTVIAGQIEIVEEDIARLYDNWFIETCDEWIVSYIGDLLGVRGLYPVGKATFSQRARVANTLGYRRRKGTATMLEQLARDTTGWNARAVEFFQLLGTTQYINHIRPDNHRTPDLRQVNKLQLLDTPFDTIAHTSDVRSISRNRGKHNIPNVGLFLWRLQSYALTDTTPRSVTNPPDGRYTFTSLGYNAPLFNRPQTEDEIIHLSEEINVPEPIRPLAFHLDLSKYYGTNRSLSITKDGKPLPPIEIMCKDLRIWDRPPVGKVAVDVRLGRIAFAIEDEPQNVSVSYNYGFSADIGGGPYDRRRPSQIDEVLADGTDTSVNLVLIRVPSTGINTVGDAIASWNSAAHTRAVIEIDDSRTYEEDITINMPGGELVIQAANFERPTMIGNVIVTGGSSQARLTLDGLLVSGSVHLQGSLEKLNILHSTLVPGVILNEEAEPQKPDEPSVIVEPPNDSLQIKIDHSIVGPLRVPSEISGLNVRDSIIESPVKDGSAIYGDEAVEDFGPKTSLERTTVFGAVHVKELTLASNVIFTDLVTAERQQSGCIRFSYVPNGSRTPSRYRCQPDLEITTQIEAVKKIILTTAQREAIRDGILKWLIPSFTSTRYGSAAYGQLSLTSPSQIRTGADDGSEMGAFSHLKQPQREANLRASLDEYLRFGLEAGIFYVS